VVLVDASDIRDAFKILQMALILLVEPKVVRAFFVLAAYIKVFGALVHNNAVLSKRLVHLADH
jgi:hypothetical protein